MFQFQKFTGICQLRTAATGTGVKDINMVVGPPVCDNTKSKQNIIEKDRKDSAMYYNIKKF